MRTALFALAVSAGLLGVSLIPSHSEATGRSRGQQSRTPVAPLRRAVRGNARKIALGRDLFFDLRLSRFERSSCASCHNLSKNGASGLRIDRNEARPMRFNTPTIFNSRYNFRFGWEGRIRTLQQANEKSIETALQGEAGLLTQRLANDRIMARRFRTIYGTGPNKKNAADALAAFIDTLVTPNAPFDRWLEGAPALTPQQVRGYARFKALGCTSCHQGVNVGGNLFQRRGIFHRMDNNEPTIVRVPSLRNVAVTAPYFHDGSVATLPEAIRKMAYYQLDIAISDHDVKDIDAFLGTLTGLYRKRRLSPAPSRPK